MIPRGSSGLEKKLCTVLSSLFVFVLGGQVVERRSSSGGSSAFSAATDGGLKKVVTRNELGSLAGGLMGDQGLLGGRYVLHAADADKRSRRQRRRQGMLGGFSWDFLKNIGFFR